MATATPCGYAHRSAFRRSDTRFGRRREPDEKLTSRTSYFTHSAKFIFRVLHVRACIFSGELVQLPYRTRPDRKMLRAAQGSRSGVDATGTESTPLRHHRERTVLRPQCAGQGPERSHRCRPTPDVVHARPADQREGEEKGRRSSRLSLGSTRRSRRAADVPRGTKCPVAHTSPFRRSKVRSSGTGREPRKGDSRMERAYLRPH